MSTQTKPKTVETVNYAKVFEDKDGIYFNKKIKTFPFVCINSNGKAVFTDDPTETKIEKVRPPEKGYTRAPVNRTVYVRKRLSSDQSISDEWVYFAVDAEFFVPENDPNFKYVWMFTTKSGRIFFIDFRSGITWDANINDPATCRKSKGKRLPDDTLLSNKAPIYEMNSAGEFELFLREPTD